MLVKDRMTSDPTTVTTDTTLKEALELIRSQAFRHLPVVDEGKLIGIISRVDIVRAIVQPCIGPSCSEEP